MRRLLLTTTLVLSAALFGCGGGASAPVAPADNNVQGNPNLDALSAEVDALNNAGYGYVEVVDVETGAVVGRTDLTRNADGSYMPDARSGSDVSFGPVANSFFRVSLVIDTDPPFAPAGYTSAGNPLYTVGQTVGYDVTLTRLFGTGSRYYKKGTIDVETRHTFAADNSLLPECIPGQNPLTIRNVNFRTKTPNVGPYAWSLDGATFSASGLQFKLCDLPGMQYGTDRICVKVYWVVTGAQLGWKQCKTCEIRCVIFDKCIGIYDPA